MAFYITHLGFKYIEFFLYLMKNKSCLLNIKKVWDPFVNQMTTILRRLISNKKIHITLSYIALNTLGGDSIQFTQKSKVF